MKLLKYYSVLLLATVLFLGGCQKQAGSPTALEGTYVSENGKYTLTFTPDGLMRTSSFGDPIASKYFIEGNVAKLKFADGIPFPFSINPDGSLTAPTGTRYEKVGK